MTTQTPLLTKVAPPALRPSHRVQYLLERNWMAFKSFWWVIIAGFFEPIFYLFSIGIGIGALVGDIQLANGDLVPYAAFVAPAMLAASAMNGAVYESTFNIFFKLRYGNVYTAALATPIGPGDIAVSEIVWSLSRGAIYSGAFLAVMGFMGLATSWWALLALPVSILIGFAFAAVGMAATTFMNSWQDFDKIQLVIMPLFLFSGTFYPLDVYPPIIQQFTKISPLYHGVELVRAFTLGNVSPNLWPHVLFLMIMGILGFSVVGRRLERLLLK